MIKNLLKRVAKERPGFWTNVVKDWKGVSEETTTGVLQLGRRLAHRIVDNSEAPEDVLARLREWLCEDFAHDRSAT